MEKTLAISWVLFAYTIYDTTGQYDTPIWQMNQPSTVEWTMEDFMENFTLNVRQHYSRRHNKLRWDLNDESYVIWSLGEQRLDYVFPAQFDGNLQMLHSIVNNPFQTETQQFNRFLTIIYPNMEQYELINDEYWLREIKNEQNSRTYSAVWLDEFPGRDPIIRKVILYSALGEGMNATEHIVTDYRNHRFEEPDDKMWDIPKGVYQTERGTKAGSLFEESLVKTYLMGRSKIWPSQEKFKNLRFSQRLDLVKNLKRQRAGVSNHKTPFPYSPSKYNNYKYPRDLDWTRCNAVTDVKDQDICRACAAFAAVGALESAYFINRGVLQNMSVQAMIDCSWTGRDPRGMYGCFAGFQNSALEWVAKNKGIPTTEEYGSFKRMNGQCKLRGGNRFNLVAPISSYTQVPSNVNALKMALLRHGPVVVGVTLEDLTHYKRNDIIRRASSKDENMIHNGLVVGYGVSPSGESYWKVRNSWGKDWGNNGYFKVLMSNKKNPLRLLDEAFYVNMKNSGTTNTYCDICDMSCKT